MTHDPLSGLTPPAPPPEIRTRVLAAAHDALARAEVPDRWSSLLSSRPLRLAWAASVLLLLGAHASVPSSAPLPARRAARDARDGEVLPLVTLPRLDDRLLPAPREASAGAPVLRSSDSKKGIAS